MIKSLTAALVGAATLGGVALQSSAASAIPMIDRAPAAIVHSAAAGQVDDVRMVCGPFGCHWRPNYYRPYPVYGYRYGHRHGYGYRGRHWQRPYYGFHRRWHRW